MAILVLLPYFLLGSSLAETFRHVNLPVLMVLALLFVVFNIFYCINRRLFLLLEKEDWPVLVRYLEDQVIGKGKYKSHLVRLLANCYLVLSDSAAVISLENRTAIVKPALVDANTLVFGTARILGKDISGAVRFFSHRKEKVKKEYKDWVGWYYGFALLLNGQYEEAGEEFTLLARESKDSVITGLSSYFLWETLAKILSDKRREYQETSSLAIEKIHKILPEIEDWNRECSRLSTEIHAAAITKYMEETGRWLYKSQIL